MIAARSTRVAARSARAAQQLRSARRHNVRLQSTSTQPAAQTGSSHVAAGVAGGSLVFLAGYAWYHFSGAKTLVNTVHSTKSTFENAFKKTTQNAPQPNEAVKWLRETVQGSARIIPGASGYVDAAFDDLDTLQQEHGEEVENIIKDAYNELKDVTKAGATWEAAVKAGDVLQRTLSKLGSLAQDAAGDLVDKHPELKEKFGSKFTQLKQMGDSYGPEAKKQVNETWNKVQDIVKSGPLNSDTYKKIQDLIRDTTEKIKKYGDEAWQKGLQEAKPILDKNPELKDFFQKNKDQLSQGNIGKLWKKLQEGDADATLKYAKEQVEELKNKATSGDGSSGGLAGLAGAFGKIPGSEEMSEKFKQLSDLYEKRGKEAEDLIKSAFKDVKDVLAKKVEEGQQLKDKAAKDVKKS